MISFPDYLREGSRIFLTSLKAKTKPKKYIGTAKEICEQIVNDCWNGRYFQTSTQNFPQFWTRDFGWCVQALLKLGYKKEIDQTLRYALNRFKETGKITTTISPQGKPFDFPALAVDSLPWLIHSIKISKFHYLPYQSFLNKEIKQLYQEVLDQHTGLVKPSQQFSSIKDFAIRKSSCYDNCMVGLLAKDLLGMKLLNPFAGHDYSDLIQRHFWNGEYFYDDLRKKNYVAGDANLFPFILGLIKNKEMMESAVKKVQEEALDGPFPLKYTSAKAEVQFIWQEKLVMRNYESDAIWTHMGPFFIKWVKHLDKEKAKEYQAAYKDLIEKYHGYPEVLTAKGKLFKTWFYCADTTMLWAVNYLEL